MPHEMIIRIGVYADAAPHRLTANFHPFLERLAAIENRLVPRFCEALNAVAITQPANVSQIGGNGIEPLEPLRRSRHPCLINERQRNASLAEHIGQLRESQFLLRISSAKR